MVSGIKQAMRTPFLKLEGWFDGIFGEQNNPFYHLGALGWFFFWIASGSGIYLYLVFDTGVSTVYESIEYLTHDQWWLGGIMRSLHRYSSDGMVLVMLIHMLREFVMDRYHGVRWFAWFTGVPLIWLLLTSGLTGYWLVWDEMAQYLAIASMEWLDALGIFSEPIANNFLKPGSLTDRFFTLLIFMHIFAPLLMLFIMWVHLLRMAHADTNPPRRLALGSLGALLVLSLVFPATSHAPADLGKAAQDLHLDWWFMAGYPIFDAIGGKALWILAVTVSAALSVVPFVIPHKKRENAEVHLDHCNGCTRCFEDCPFGAISMQPRTDGARYDQEAVVKPSFCTGCGICVGSCPASTPFRRVDDLPDLPLTALRDRMSKESARIDGEAKVLVFGCSWGADLKALEDAGTGSVQLSCIGQLPPSFVDYALNRGGIDGVVLTACRSGDCYHRLGVRWTEERLTGYRDPYLRPRIPREKIRLAWAASTDQKRLEEEVADFKRELAERKRAEAGDTAEGKDNAALARAGE